MVPTFASPHEVPEVSGTADAAQHAFAELLAHADIELMGERPWDIHVNNPRTFRRILKYGSIGLGESYVDGWWDCERIDEFICRVLQARLDQKVHNPALAILALKAKLMNQQSVPRSWKVAQAHYDLGNDLFQAMLDPTMAYSCGYWRDAATLEEAQNAKLDLVCKKLLLRPGMRLLDIGCGWGSLMRYATEHYGVECVGVTVSKEQKALGQTLTRGLPVQFELTDYRLFNQQGVKKFDRIASIGMFEHVGYKNYSVYLDVVRRSIADDGLFLLHTIGKNRKGLGLDPWIEKYIFPNGYLPALSELAEVAETRFVIEDIHNFGADYDRTLMAWLENFDAAWDRLKTHYPPQFRRMWRYYLMACAGTFRARDNQLWQWVMSPRGHVGGYRRPTT